MTHVGLKDPAPEANLHRPRDLPVILTLLVALGPVSTDLYLPSLPGMAEDLQTTPALAQLTIGLFIAGFALMMLVVGPLADRFGRRPVLLAGLAVYVAATLGCVASQSITVLLCARFLEAVGASVGPVLGRAIVRDLYPPKAAARVFGSMSSAMALGPMVGPFLGGWLETSFGWRANFWFIAIYGLVLLALLAWRLPETRPEGGVQPGIKALVSSFCAMLNHRFFLGCMLCASLSFGALFTWISNAAFVVIVHFKVAPDQFAWAFGTAIFGYLTGAYAGGRIGGRIGLRRTLGAGSLISALAGAALLLLGWSGTGGLPAVVLAMMVSFFGAGCVIPQATAGGLAPFPDRAGTAAALMGFVQMSTGLLVNVLSSLLFDGSPRPMIILNAACGILCLIVFARLMRRQPTLVNKITS